jgi:hypothetical protein
MRKWVLVWIVSLVLVAAATSVLTRAQIQDDPRIKSGSDIGFRVESTNPAGDAVGTFVVRVNGRWVNATSAFGIKRPGTQ